MFTNFLFYKIFIFLFVNKIKCKLGEYISLPFEESYGRFEVTLGFGSPVQKRQYIIDLSTEYCWNHIGIYNPTKSSYSKEIGRALIPVDNSEIKTYIRYQDTFTLYYTNNTYLRLTNFPFLFYEQPTSEFQTIGITFSFTDPDYSITDVLYKTKTIPKRQFAIHQNNFTHGELIFGEINDNYTTGKWVSSCKINKTFKKWGCNMESIMINSVKYQVNDYAFFNSMNNKIFVPKKFMDFLTETIFKPFIEAKTCEKSVINQIFVIVCEWRVVKFFDDLVLNFDNGSKLIIVKDIMFTRFFDKCLFVIKNQGTKRNSWEIGTVAFKNHTIVFDYENENITFYSSVMQIANKMKYLFSFIVINSFVLMIFIVLELLILYKNKK